MKEQLAKVLRGERLAEDEAGAAMGTIMVGEATPANSVRPSWWISEVLPCISLAARTTLPPKACPSD